MTLDEKKSKRSEEDIKNKKTLPLLRQAFALAMKIEEKLEEKKRQIAKLRKSKKKLNSSLTSRRSLSELGHDVSYATTARSAKSNKPLHNYKSTMCPLENRCPNDSRPRWPSTKTSGIRQLGYACPYAHHYSELHFVYIFKTNINREEDKTREKGINKQVKNLQATMEVDDKKPNWIHASTLKPCTGCGIVGEKNKPCNTCQLKELMRQKHEKYKKATDKKNKILLASKEQKEKAEKIREHDDKYTHKFGLLKKTDVLLKIERWGDAYNTILEAVNMVREDKIEEEKAKQEREKRIRASLGIPLGIDINYEKLKAEPLTKERLKKLDIDLPLETVQVLLAKLSIEDPNFQNKNTYLNEQIIELYEVVHKIAKSQRKYLNSLKKKKEEVESLDPNRPDKSRKMSKRRLSTTLVICENVKRYSNFHIKCIEKCNNKQCEYPHSAIELDLENPEIKVKNLQNTITATAERLMESKTIEPWRPTRSGTVELSKTKYKVIGRKVDAKTRAFLEPKRRLSEGGKSLIEQDLKENFDAYFENI